MTASLLRASAISGVLKLQGVLMSRPGLAPSEAAKHLRQTDPSAASLDLNAGCELLDLIGTTQALTPEGVFRACISAVACSAAPGWLATLPQGRDALSDSLDENAYQCFRIAGAFEPFPHPEVLLWLDELASAQFTMEDRRNLLLGREGERLTLEAETKKLRQLSIARSPRWVALDNNRAGFDIESWRLDVNGNEMPILIEVKACSGLSCRFFLTRNEWQNACKHPGQYELHVWRLADQASVVLTYADISDHVPVDQGSGRWESVQVQLSPHLFATST